MQLLNKKYTVSFSLYRVEYVNVFDELHTRSSDKDYSIIISTLSSIMNGYVIFTYQEDVSMSLKKC